MAYAGKPPTRTSESVLEALPLMFYLALSIGLMFADQRHGYGTIARQKSAYVTEPLWWLASAPMRLYRGATENLALRSQLQADNQRKRRELQMAQARIHRLMAVADENARLRQLLGGTRGFSLNVSMAGIIDIDLDPFRQRLVLDAGSEDKVRVGQALIDSDGVLGQVVEVSPRRATALLITDPDHAVPVQVARSGLRTIAYGTGSSDRLVLPNIPQSADIRKGDQLITSGIGGRFPAGFPVGTITRLRADKLRLFVIADATPAAHLERGNEVLLISNLPIEVDIGPPGPPPNTVPQVPALEALPAAGAASARPVADKPAPAAAGTTP